MNEIQKLFPHIRQPITPAQQQYIIEQLKIMGIDVSNSYQELTMTSPWVDAHCDTSYFNDSIKLHSHNFYEILCCTNTCGAEYLLDSLRYRLQKGDILFIPPGTSHRPILPDNLTDGYRRDVLWLSPEFMDNIKQVCKEWQCHSHYIPFLIRTSDTQWEFLTDIIHLCVAEYEKSEPGWQNIVVGNAMVLLTHMERAFRDASTRAINAEPPQLLDRIITYVDENYENSITLADVAQKFYISQSTVSHLFKEKLGVSFYRCVTQRRLIAAKDLIAQGASLETVCEKVGFNDYSSFYRSFKREYGISPRQYRML